MSKRTTGTTASDSTTPAPRRRKPASTGTEAPKTIRTRRKASAPVPSEAPDAAAAPLIPSAEDVATRAYFIALERGFPGDPVADWLQAERDLNVFRS